jgi:hypothetical protein
MRQRKVATIRALEPASPTCRGYIGLVAHGKVAVRQRQLICLAVVNKPFDGGFDQPDATVVAVQFHVLDQVVDGTEPGPVVSVSTMSTVSHSYSTTSAQKLRTMMEMVLPW